MPHQIVPSVNRSGVALVEGSRTVCRGFLFRGVAEAWDSDQTACGGTEFSKASLIAGTEKGPTRSLPSRRLNKGTECGMLGSTTEFHVLLVRAFFFFFKSL